MNLGRMRHRVTLEAIPTDQARNPLGEQRQAWQAEQVCWARVETLDGRELYREVQVQPSATHKVTIRYRPGVTEAKRFDFRGRYLNIYRVDNADQLNDELICYCFEAK